MDIEPGQQIPAMNEVSSWFQSLSRGLRVTLFANPDARLSGDQAAEVVRSGMLIAGAWFTSAQDGPGGFNLPSDVVDFIEGERDTLDDWWSGLPDDKKEAWLTLGDEPLPEALRSPYPSGYLLPLPMDGYVPQHADLVLIDYVQTKGQA